MEAAISVQKLYVRYETVERRSVLNLFSKHKKVRCINALRNVSFEVPKGEILGIIGSNGSGKSTLLRTLAGLMAPTMGSVDLHGRTVSLLSLGTGFIPDLSGKDNIILSGLSMGFSKQEIMKKYNSIVAFSELGDAILRPVKTYSSGMYSKLAFSIAVTLRTDILLIDEILSVGDLQFRKKSRAALEQLIMDKDRTVVFVSHNLSEVKSLCSRVMWLDHGKICAMGDTEEVLEAYHIHMASDPLSITYLEAPTLRVTSGADRIHLSWEAVDNAVDYRLYRKENVPGAQWAWLEDGYRGLSYDDVPPSAEVSYLYAIRARAENSNGSVWSEIKAGVSGKLG